MAFASLLASDAAGTADAYRVGHSLYFVCDSAADTKAKVATSSDITTTVNGVTRTIKAASLTDADLFQGMIITVRFTNTLTDTSNPTLKVDQCTARPIKRYGTTGPNSLVTSWYANSPVQLMWDTVSTATGAWLIAGQCNNWENSDINVQQNARAATSGNNHDYPLIFKSTTATAGITSTVAFASGKTIAANPYTGAITASNYSGGTTNSITLTKSSGTDGPNSSTLYYTQVGKMVCVQMMGFASTSPSQQVVYTFNTALPTPAVGTVLCSSSGTASTGNNSAFIDTSGKTITFPTGQSHTADEAIVWTYLVS